MIKKGLYNIPNNWYWSKLGEITSVIGGGTSSSKINEYYDNGDIAWITPSDLSNYNNMYISKGKKMITKLGLMKSSAKLLPKGTVCLSSRAPIGYVVIAKNELSTNQGFKSFLPSKVFKSEYLYWYLKSIKHILEAKASGTTFLELSAKKAGEVEIPLPPLNEQQRIVNIIESLFTKLDRAKELIENTLAQFEQNKMAILHKAFIGELTEKWRKEKGILKDTWKSMALENCGTWSGGGTPSMSCGDYWENGNIPWITSKDMKNIYIEKTQKYITEKGVECSSAKYIDKPAILFVTRSGILRRIFPVCMVKIPFTVNQDLKVLVPSKMVCLEYLYWICIYKSNKILGTCMKSGTTVESISTDKLKKFKITVPTIEEQQEIVNILDNLLAKYNKIKNLEQQLEKIELLKKAILAKAFRGELGTNNPDEESAENLLKEILAEK